MDSTCKYVRGSVWYAADKDIFSDKAIANTHTQRGSRLVIIFSSNVGNVTSDMVNVIPLSTKVSKKMKINVPVLGYDGVEQIALCNMLMPMPKEYLIEYKYTLSDKTMKEVELGVLVANEMDSYAKTEEVAYTFDQLKSVIESIVSHRVSMILESERKSANKIGIVEISNMVENLMKNASDEVKADMAPVLRKSDEPHVVDILAQEADKLRRCEGGRRIWTKEMCKLFINDRDVKGKKETSRLWGIKEASVNSTYSLCKARLRKFK